MDIKNELQYFKDNNIRIKVIDLPTTMLDLPKEQSWVIDMVNNILIEVLSSIAEQEYHTIHKRQSEGIAAAKAKGIRFGRPPQPLPENFHTMYQKWKQGEVTGTAAAKACGMPLSTFRYRAEVYENAKLL